MTCPEHPTVETSTWHCRGVHLAFPSRLSMGGIPPPCPSAMWQPLVFDFLTPADPQTARVWTVESHREVRGMQVSRFTHSVYCFLFLLHTSSLPPAPWHTVMMLRPMSFPISLLTWTRLSARRARVPSLSVGHSLGAVRIPHFGVGLIVSSSFARRGGRLNSRTIHRAWRACIGIRPSATPWRQSRRTRHFVSGTFAVRSQI